VIGGGNFPQLPIGTDGFVRARSVGGAHGSLDIPCASMNGHRSSIIAPRASVNVAR